MKYQKYNRIAYNLNFGGIHLLLNFKNKKTLRSLRLRVYQMPKTNLHGL